MKTFSRLFNLMLGTICLVSCTVTNNLYFANPNPMGKGNKLAYVGIGTGIQAKIDSVNPNNGNINFSNKISTAPVLSLGVQIGVSNQTDVRVAVHFPKLFGGAGIRGGVQHSFFDSNSTFNMALGMDLGGVFSKDSIKIFGSKTSVSKETNGALNADFFIPLSVKFKEDLLLILTPRYSFNTFYIRKNQNNSEETSFGISYPAVSLALRNKKYYFETTVLYYDEKVYPHFGIVRLINF